LNTRTIKKVLIASTFFADRIAVASVDVLLKLIYCIFVSLPILFFANYVLSAIWVNAFLFSSKKSIFTKIGRVVNLLIWNFFFPFFVVVIDLYAFCKGAPSESDLSKLKDIVDPHSAAVILASRAKREAFHAAMFELFRQKDEVIKGLDEIQNSSMNLNASQSRSSNFDRLSEIDRKEEDSDENVSSSISQYLGISVGHNNVNDEFITFKQFWQVIKSLSVFSILPSIQQSDSKKGDKGFGKGNSGIQLVDSQEKNKLGDKEIQLQNLKPKKQADLDQDDKPFNRVKSKKLGKLLFGYGKTIFDYIVEKCNSEIEKIPLTQRQKFCIDTFISVEEFAQILFETILSQQEKSSANKMDVNEFIKSNLSLPFLSVLPFPSVLSAILYMEPEDVISTLNSEVKSFQAKIETRIEQIDIKLDQVLRFYSMNHQLKQDQNTKDDN